MVLSEEKVNTREKMSNWYIRDKHKSDSERETKILNIIASDLPDTIGITIDEYIEAGYEFRWGLGDVVLSTKSFKKAAELGSMRAMYEVSYNFNKIGNKEQDYYWLTKAAKAGYPLAVFSLGKEYFWGNDLPQDYKKAKEYFKHAMELGDNCSAYYLGFCAEEGILEPVDLEKALYYYKSVKTIMDCKRKIPVVLIKMGDKKLKENEPEESLDLYEQARRILEVQIAREYIKEKACMKELIFKIYTLKRFDRESFGLYDLYYLMRKPCKVTFSFYDERHEITAVENNNGIAILYDGKAFRTIDDFFDNALLGRRKISACIEEIHDFRL